MAHPIDVRTLIGDIEHAATDALKKDITLIAGFSRTQVEALAKQAAWIAEATAKGELDQELRRFFLSNLEEMARNFVNVLQGLAAIAIEKVWNAVVGVLWGAIRKAASAAIPIPKF
jgi:hypothetical protein